MKKRTRNFLFIFFILIFICITPVIALYASGYKISLSWPLKLNQLFQKTGMFIIETNPEGADIYIDDKAQANFLKKLYREDSLIKTPAKIKNLKPGDYRIRLSKNGYWDWEKKLRIEAGQSTILQNIELFANNLPLKLVDNTDTQVNLSPNKKYLTYIEANNLVIFNITKNEESKKKITEQNSNQKTIWSPDSNKLIFQNIIFFLEEDKEINLNLIFEQKIKDLKWASNSSMVYLLFANGNIMSYDIKNDKTEIIFERENCLDFSMTDNQLLCLSSSSNSIKLKSFSLKNKNLIKEISFPYSEDYKLVSANSKFVHVYDTKYQTLYLVDLNSPFRPVKEIINNIKYFDWQGDELLYANDFEIWRINIQEGKKELITRISKPISSIAWYANENNIIYTDDKSVNIIDLYDQNKKNTLELLKTEYCDFIDLDKEEDIIYLQAKIGQQEGVWQLAIKN